MASDQPHNDSPSNDESALFGRDAALIQLEEQFDKIYHRIDKDFQRMAHKQSKNSPEISFFTYPLYQRNGKPLSIDALEDFDISEKGLVKTEGFQKVENAVEKQGYQARLDSYLLFSSKDAKRYLRLVIEEEGSLWPQATT